MIISLLAILLVVLLIMIYNVYSKYNIFFVAIMAGIFVSILAVVMYITTVSYYTGILSIEVIISSVFKKFTLNISTIKLILVIGYEIIFISNIVIFNELTYNDFKHKIVWIGLSAIAALVFSLINISYLSDSIYIFLVENFGYSRIDFFNTVFMLVNYTVIMYFLVLPVPAAVANVRRTSLMFIRRQNFIMVIMLILYDIMIFLISTYAVMCNLLTIFVLNNINTNMLYDGKFVIVLPVLLMIVFAVYIFVVKLDMINNVDFKKRSVMEKNMKVLVTEWQYIFHDFKNIMLEIVALDDSAQKNYGTEEGMLELKKIKSCAYSYAEKVGSLQDIYRRNKKINIKEIDILDAVNSAVEGIRNESGVTINLINYPDYSIINGDRYQVEMLFYNIIKNSAEAISNKGNSDGKIDILFIEEGEWLCIEIYDNGEGINKKFIRRIWKPIKSTKNTFMNWGIGLSQCKKIVDAHLGHIDIESRENEYTRVQICFKK